MKHTVTQTKEDDIMTHPNNKPPYMGENQSISHILIINILTTLISTFTNYSLIYKKKIRRKILGKGTQLTIKKIEQMRYLLLSFVDKRYDKNQLS